MKVKKEAVILAVVIIGLSFYLVLHQGDKTHYTLPVIAQVAEGDVSKIEVSKPDGTLTLNKEGDQWVLSPEGYPAEESKVKSMLDVISGLTLTALASESKSYERYDLEEGKKITVKAWAGETLARSFDIGKAAPSYSHTFVKMAGDHRVYHARSNFRGRFDQTVDNLRDRSALSFQTAEIQGIRVEKGETALSLVRQSVPVEVSAAQEGGAEAPKEAWIVEGQEEERQVHGSKVDKLLATLSNLKCSAYVDGKTKGDFSNPLYSVELKGTENYKLDIFEKMSTEEKRHPAVSSQNDFPFFLSDYLAGQIMVPLEDLTMKREGTEAPEEK